MLNQTLQQIGLTPKESQVYEILLRLGEVPIGDLIKETGDHPQIVYRAIDGLESKNLVICANIRHKKHVRAENPQKLVEIEEKRLKEINKILPTLVALQQTPKEVVVRTHKGNEAVRSFRFKALDKMTESDIFYIIGASGDRYYEVMGPQMLEWENARVKKNVYKKLITFESQRGTLKNIENQMRLAEIRYMADNFPVPVSINVARDQSALIIWDPEPIVVSIESPKIAENYINYFNVLWQIATE